jgi:hypothetical protein
MTKKQKKKLIMPAFYVYNIICFVTLTNTLSVLTPFTYLKSIIYFYNIDSL